MIDGRSFGIASMSFIDYLYAPSMAGYIGVD